MTLAEIAAHRLVSPVHAEPLEKFWIIAALSNLATGKPEDPDAAALCALTDPVQIWSNIVLSSTELLQNRIGRLRDCHYLAIATENMEWLATLAQCWEQAPDIVEPWWPLRSLGEIALCTGAGTTWTAEEIEALTEELIICPDAPSDRAWLALARGERQAARHALADYEARLSQEMNDWRQAPERGIRQALACPAIVFRTELRALKELSVAA